MRHDYEDRTLTPVLAFVARLASPFTVRLARRRVKQWCRRQGYHLLRWRDAKLFEGPSTWTAEQDRYRIQVLDDEGHQHGGYLVFRRWWSPTQRAQVLWDEPMPSRASGSMPLLDGEH